MIFSMPKGVRYCQKNKTKKNCDFVYNDKTVFLLDFFFCVVLWLIWARRGHLTLKLFILFVFYSVVMTAVMEIHFFHL